VVCFGLRGLYSSLAYPSFIGAPVSQQKRRGLGRVGIGPVILCVRHEAEGHLIMTDGVLFQVLCRELC
jgi:hypothetical protein